MWGYYLKQVRCPRVHYVKHVRLYMSAQHEYELELCCTTYTYATQIETRSYVHV